MCDGAVVETHHSGGVGILGTVHHPGENRGNLAEGPAEPVEIMDVQVQEHATGLGRIRKPVVAAARVPVVPGRPYDAGPAQLTRLYHLGGVRVAREITERMAYTQSHSRLAAGPDDGLAVVQRQGDGLFAEDVLAGFRRSDSVFPVQMGWCRLQ